MSTIDTAGTTTLNAYLLTVADSTATPPNMNIIEDTLAELADKVGLVDKMPKRGKYWKPERSRALRLQE